MGLRFFKFRNRILVYEVISRHTKKVETHKKTVTCER